MGIGQGLSRPAWKGRLEGPHFHPAVVRIGSPAARLAVVRCGKISEDEMSPSDPGVTQSNQVMPIVHTVAGARSTSAHRVTA